MLALTVAVFTGCGGSSPQNGWRETVEGSLRRLEEARSFHYRLHLENWVSVSGQVVYGDERGEGSLVGEDFSLRLQRRSPAGEESLELASWQDVLYRKNNGSWTVLDKENHPSPALDPRCLLGILSAFHGIELAGREERGGKECDLFLLHLDGGEAEKALSAGARSYYSHLRYEVRGRAWISDPGSPPVSLELEVVGYDPVESLQRYRMLLTVDPYDIDSPAVQLTVPLQSEE